MVRISLSDEEVELLQDYSTTSPISLIRQKAQAVLLRSRTVKVYDIAFSMGCGYRTVERWLKDFQDQRMASIFSGLVDNENAAKLTRAQKEDIKRVLQNPPSDHGLPKGFWDVPTLKKYVKAEFGVVYESIQSYHFLLKFSQLSFKYPAKFSIYRDEEKIVKRIEEVRVEVSQYLKDPNWEVFTSDEVRIMLEAVTRRAWLKKGEKTVVKVKRSKDYQNYLGFLDQKTFKCQVYPIAWGRQTEIIKATAAHIANYPGKRICVIWDNARCHNGRLVRKELRKGSSLERAHLIALPPYAPDMNPIEHVWERGKNEISNTQFETFDNTKQVFEKAITSREFHYEI